MADDAEYYRGLLRDAEREIADQANDERKKIRADVAEIKENYWKGARLTEEFKALNADIQAVGKRCDAIEKKLAYYAGAVAVIVWAITHFLKL